MSVTVTIEGLAELQAAAARAGSSIDEDVAEGLRQAATIVAGRAQRNAPVVSGRLRGSIAPVSKGLASEVEVTATRSSRSYPNFPYPVRIERSQPFLVPAVTQESARIEEAMEKVLEEVSRKWGGS